MNSYNVEDPLLKNFIELFYFEAEQGDRNGKRDARSIEEFILDNLEEPISVEDLATRLNLSKFYFLREFKKASGHAGLQGPPRRIARELS